VIREERARERERELRRLEREERDFREKKKDIEVRDRERERDRERHERDKIRDRERAIERELNYDSDEELRRRKSGRRKRAREREDEEDERDRIQEKDAELFAKYEKDKEEKERLIKEQIFRDKEREEGEMVETDEEQKQREDLRAVREIKLGFGLGSKKVNLTATPGFNVDEPVNPLPVPKRKKLVPLEPLKSNEQIKKEKEEAAKQIVEMIPTKKEDLVVFEMDWAIIDEKNIVKTIMEPWVKKKIRDYVGEEEPTLIEFILKMLLDHISPTEILEQVLPVLDEEAEAFVIKLWRLLIFEMIRHRRQK